MYPSRQIHTFLFCLWIKQKWPRGRITTVLHVLISKQPENTYPDPETGTPCAWCISHLMRGPLSEEQVSDLCQKRSASPKDTQHKAQPATSPVSTERKTGEEFICSTLSSKKPTLARVLWAKLPDLISRRSSHEKTAPENVLIFLLFSVQLTEIFADGLRVEKSFYKRPDHALQMAEAPICANQRGQEWMGKLVLT